MEQEQFIFTSESVSEGHPDKLCDRISDSLLDAALARDANARVALETLVSKNLCVVAGETSAKEPLQQEEIEAIAREAIKEIGYAQSDFHWEKARFLANVQPQSSDIALGTDDDVSNQGEGAGDQGIMFGFACDETPQAMPAPIYYAHRMLENLLTARKSGQVEGLGPDAKSQITLAYENGRPVRAHTILLSSQHDASLSREEVAARLKPIAEQALPEGWWDKETRFLVNPTGRFVEGGPAADAGLTGRKIIVDTYGGAAPHGGGAFSGKDPTKVDRSAAYAARWLAKNIVAAKLARRCTLQLAYAIGRPEPIGLFLDLGKEAQVCRQKLADYLLEEVDLTPRGIRTKLNLRRPIYARTAAYGHFGRAPEEDGGFSWEKTDLADQLASSFA